MNSIKVKKMFGKDSYEITVESESIIECFQKISVFSEVSKCSCCGGENIYFSYRRVSPKEGRNAGKNFEYLDFVCRDCGAKANIGMYQAGGVFLKKFEKYEPMKPSMPTDNPNEAQDEPDPSWAKGPVNDKPQVQTGPLTPTGRLGNNPPRF